MVNFYDNIRLLRGQTVLASLNCRIFTKYATWPKSTLLSKISDLDPETKIFLYISKGINGKFSILGQLDHFLEGS